MTILLIFLLEHSLKALVLKDQRVVGSFAFSHLDVFLSSSLWTSHKQTPRVIYTEKDKDLCFLNLDNLSFLEKILLWARKRFLTPTTSIVWLKTQFLIFEPIVPTLLQEGPVLKITSLSFEVIKSLAKASETFSGFGHYQHPAIGLWKVEIQENQIRSWAFSPEVKEPPIEEQHEKNDYFFPHTGISSQDTSSLNLATLFPGNILPGLKNLGLANQVLQFPSPAHKGLAACVLLVMAIIYNITCIEKWESELNATRSHLKLIKEKAQTPHYLLVKNHIEAQGN